MIKPNLKQKIKNTVNANRIIAMKYVENALKSTEKNTQKSPITRKPKDVLLTKI